ncbi:iron-containing alcohol dehydrogenase family protein [Enterococcus entomosocium]|jgi:glycerol dehydrogenase-like iron-containing ADH family enzyme|uniref:iron-containing alcohol dehydrogenase family protein n=1 Tax=Enterococcus TaxID=1350 RepID=UPI000A34A091|nr:iron-containing alcohol dehydrogenase family protein [Enterococcus sp. 3C8_DIV0646]MBO1123468.1 iron-containing alcohol dehydrogenase family protein [Enterococcus casseliflavus]
MSQSIFLPNYTIGADAYEKVNDIVKPYGTNAVIIGGKTALEKAEDKIKAGLTSAVKVTDTLWYGGNSTYENVDQLLANPSVQAADVLFAVGGGRVCDTVKVVGEKAGKPVFTFPTIGSNCSPVTAVCVIYKENGEMQGLFFPSQPPTHAFIDSEIIAQAPDKYLWAGIGDALSKEIESTFSARGDELDYTDGLGIQIGKMCTERLLQYGTQALKDSAANQPSYAIEQVVLDIIVTTGLVSVLVINDYNSALAHSFYYGTTVLEKMEDYLHGASVSYGVLALLQLDQQEALFQRIYAFMKENKLPVCLADMGLNATSDLEAILDKAMTTNDIVHVPYEITREMFKQAILDVEAYHAKQNQASLAAAN